MKVAVSLPDPLFEAADELAEQLNLRRSQLYARALESYIGSRAASAITEKLNAVYAREPSGIDRAWLEAQRRSLSDEAW